MSVPLHETHLSCLHESEYLPYQVIKLAGILYNFIGDVTGMPIILLFCVVCSLARFAS